MFKLLRNSSVLCTVCLTLFSHATEGRSQAEIIATGSETDIIKLLENGFNPTTTVYHGQQHRTVFHFAAGRGQTQVFEFAQSHYPNIDLNPALPSGSHEGMTPLHCAGDNGHTKIFAWFHSNFPDMNLNPAIKSGPCKGQTPLHLAAQRGHTHLFDWCKNNCPEMNINPPAAGQNEGITPLIDGIVQGQLRVVEWFAEHKYSFDVHIENGRHQGHTAVTKAVENKRMLVVRYLVFLEATLKGKLDPAEFARIKGYKDLAMYLEQTAPRTQQLLNICSQLRDSITGAEKLKSTLISLKNQEHPDKNRIDRYEKFLIPLMWRSLEFSSDEIPIKVLAGAEIDAPENPLCATTPLHLLIHAPTCNRALFKIIRWLINERKANVNALDLERNTPLSIACAKGNRWLALLLLGYGAQPAIGKNPLLAAFEHATQDKFIPIFAKILCGSNLSTR